MSTQKKQGFTLIELMVVIVIIGILAAIAIPKLFGMTAKAKAQEVGPAAGTWVKLQTAFIMEHGKYGGFKDIGYVAPGEKQISAGNDTYKSKYFTYIGSDNKIEEVPESAPDENDGTPGKDADAATWQGLNHDALGNGCNANGWDITMEFGSSSDKDAPDVPTIPLGTITKDCYALTTSFGSLGKITGTPKAN